MMGNSVAAWGQCDFSCLYSSLVTSVKSRQKCMREYFGIGWYKCLIYYMLVYFNKLFGKVKLLGPAVSNWERVLGQIRGSTQVL